MAKIDTLIKHMVDRGATTLRMVPGDFPSFELPGGHRSTTGHAIIHGSVIDGMVKEILPVEFDEDFQRGKEIRFNYVFGNDLLKVLVRKSSGGAQVVIVRSLRVDSKEDAPPIAVRFKALGPLLKRLVQEGGSDVYLNANEPAIIRLEGQLEVDREGGIWSPKDLEELVKAWPPPPVLEIYQSGQDTEFTCGQPEAHFRLRVSLLHDTHAPAVAIRVIPKKIPDAETLGLGKWIQRLSGLNKGLVLLAGPMGSGKTTTLACLLNLANHTRKDYIVAIQDSLEFEYPEGSCLIRQRETACCLDTQKRAIRAVLRQAPAILSVGELRDAETIDLTLQAAHTGRLVFAMVPTATITDTLYYLVEAFPQDRQDSIRSRLAEVLKAMLGHSLVRKIGGGQTVALETLFNNSTIAALIRENRYAAIPGAMKTGRYGQVSHNDALIQLISNQAVDPMEAYLRCHDRESFILSCKNVGIEFDPRAEGQMVTEE